MPPPPFEPAVMGTLDVLKVLGQGATGPVFLAQDGTTHAYVALKVLAARAQDKEIQGAVREELAFCRKYPSPNLRSVRRMEHDADRLLVVLDFVNGADLGRLLGYLARNKRKLPPLLGHHVVVSVTHAVALMHGRKDDAGPLAPWAHGDLGPGNILVNQAGLVKLADVGRVSAGLRTRTPRPGKTAYRAPELQDGARPSPRADVWSLGVILWECLTGKRLFKGPDDQAIEAATRAGPTHTPRQHEAMVPQRLSDVVMTALCLDPAGRFEDAQALLAAMEGAVEAPALDKLEGALGKLVKQFVPLPSIAELDALPRARGLPVLLPDVPPSNPKLEFEDSTDSVPEGDAPEAWGRMNESFAHALSGSDDPRQGMPALPRAQVDTTVPAAGHDATQVLALPKDMAWPDQEDIPTAPGFLAPGLVEGAALVDASAGEIPQATMQLTVLDDPLLNATHPGAPSHAAPPPEDDPRLITQPMLTPMPAELVGGGAPAPSPTHPVDTPGEKAPLTTELPILNHQAVVEARAKRAAAAASPAPAPEEPLEFDAGSDPRMTPARLAAAGIHLNQPHRTKAPKAKGGFWVSEGSEEPRRTDPHVVLKRVLDPSIPRTFVVRLPSGTERTSVEVGALLALDHLALFPGLGDPPRHAGSAHTGRLQMFWSTYQEQHMTGVWSLIGPSPGQYGAVYMVQGSLHYVCLAGYHPPFVGALLPDQGLAFQEAGTLLSGALEGQRPLLEVVLDANLGTPQSVLARFQTWLLQRTHLMLAWGQCHYEFRPELRLPFALPVLPIPMGSVLHLAESLHAGR